MKGLTRGVSRAGTLIGSLVWSVLLAAPASAALIRTQAPCAGTTGYCKLFKAGAAIPVIRKFTFVAPTRGVVQVTFHGSLYCFNNAGKDAVVDLASQIVTTTRATPSQNGPGGLRHVIIMKDSIQHSHSAADTFNLASTRVISLKAGSSDFFFKIQALKMDANTGCYVYNASFSIVFIQ